MYNVTYLIIVSILLLIVILYIYICVCVCVCTVSSTNIGTLDKYEQRQLWK